LDRPFQTAFQLTLPPGWTICWMLALGTVRLERQTIFAPRETAIPSVFALCETVIEESLTF
jgi:hypothetical protein